MSRKYNLDEDWCDDAPGPPVFKIPSCFAANVSSGGNSSSVLPAKSKQGFIGEDGNYEIEDDYADFDDDDWDMHYYTGDSNKNNRTVFDGAPVSSEPQSSVTKPSKASLAESRSSLVALGTPLGSIEYDQGVLERLCQLWEAKPINYRQVSQQLQEAFEHAANPYLTTMYLVQSAPDYHKAKTTGLSLCVLKEFDKWIASRHERYANCLNELVKKDAFLIAIRAAHFTYVDHIIRCFLLSHDGNEYLLKYICEFLAEKKFKEAATCVTKLQLQKHFNIKDIVLPLIVQDKTNLVESYVDKNEQLQLELVRLLDEMVADRHLALDLVRQLEIPDVKWEKLEPKKLSKLAVRLMKAFNMTQSVCPHIDAVRSEKALMFLIYRRYIEQSLEESQWSDLVEVKLVDELVTYQDILEAARWACHYDMAASDLPSQVNELLASLPESSMTLNREVAAPASDKYHVFSLPRSAIHWVSDQLTLYECVQTLSQCSGPLGFDAEWRPTLGQTLNPRVSIVQLATDCHVYLLDIVTLKSTLSDNDWLLFGSQVLANDALIKMGYGVSEDMHMLTASVPCLDDVMAACRVLDLHYIHAKMGMIAPGLFDDAVKQQQAAVNDSPATGEKAKSERGLSEMVRCYLGRPLDKSQQMSDWERRPLREAQILYAALDALSAVEVYRVIESRIRERGLSLDLILKFTFTVARKSKPGKHQAMTATRGDGTGVTQSASSSNAKQTSFNTGSGLDLDSWPTLSATVGVNDKRVTATEQPKTGKKSSVAQRIATSVKSITSPVAEPTSLASSSVPAAEAASPARSPDQLRVVVDTMLQGLGRQLRCCGVDVRILDTDEDHLKAAEISHLENRVILTSGVPYAMLNARVPAGRCLFIPCSVSAKDQAAIVFQHFGVKVTEADIFSRCQACNGNKYVTISANEVEAMCTRLKGQGQSESVIDNKAVSTITKNKPLPLTSKVLVAHEYDPATAKLTNGPQIQLDTIPASVLRHVDMFYVCATCGKVFWDGLHYNSVLQQFAHLLTPSSDTTSTETAADDTACDATTTATVTAAAAGVDNTSSSVPVASVSSKPDYDYDAEIWD